MKKFIKLKWPMLYPFLPVVGFMLAVGLAGASDWANPNPRAGGDLAGPLLLKHESNMTDLYQSTTGKLNLLKSNHAGGSGPVSPNAGQAWYDTTNLLYKVYDSTWGGGGFYSTGTSSFPGAIVSGGTNTFSGTQNITGGINSSGTNTFSGTTAITGTATFTGPASFNRTGYSPFSTSSTTLVTNLNADLLDGYSASTTTAASVIPVTGGDGTIDSAFIPNLAINGVFTTITTSQTWTVPTGVDRIYLFLSGGGGGGGGGEDFTGTGYQSGCGGGAGKQITWFSLATTPTDTYDIVIGAGGTAGAAGSAGVGGNGGAGGETYISKLGTKVIGAGGGPGGGGGNHSSACSTSARGTSVTWGSTPTIPSGGTAQGDYMATTTWFDFAPTYAFSGSAGVDIAGVNCGAAGATHPGGNGGGPGGGRGGVCGHDSTGEAGVAGTAGTGSGGGGGGGNTGAGIGGAGSAGATGYLTILYFQKT